MISVLTFSIRRQSHYIIMSLYYIRFTKMCYHVTMRKDMVSVRDFLKQQYRKRS